MSAMEASKSVASSQTSDGQSCCVSSLAKLKEEIKKEVVEEVLKVLKEKQPTTVVDYSNDENKGDAAAAAAPTSKVAGKVVHPGIFCDHCDQQITGVRYKCGNCKDFDLCEECEKIPDIHDYTHIFLKLRYPFSVYMNADPKSNRAASDGRDFIKQIFGAGDEEPEKNKDDDKMAMRAKFISDETVPDGATFPPGMKFIKCWKVANAGTKPWTRDTFVRQVWSSWEMKPYITEVSVPPLNCGEEGLVSVYFNAPAVPGDYESYWEFVHQGKSFGDTLWCRIRVVQPLPLYQYSSSPEDLHHKSLLTKGLRVDQLQCLVRNRRKVKEEKRKRKECRKREVKQIVDVLTAVQEEHSRSNVVSLKPVVTSHTATPNNTPFDLTPPKSPEPREFIEMKADGAASAEAGVQGEQLSEHVDSGLEYETKASVSALSSSESDSEFVVIPMPKCFSLLESYAAGQPSDATQCAENGKQAIASTQEEAPLNIPKSGNSENVSQETGAPEEAENYNINAAGHVKEDLANKVVIPEASLSSSPSSSSSVSVIESDDNSSPASSPQNRKQSDAEQRQESARQSEALSSQEVVHHPPAAEEQSEEMPSSCTFPKFPLATEVEQATESPAGPVQENERTIQVLPEGLVTGALIAAASVYNTARAVISSIQPGRNEQEESSSLAARRRSLSSSSEEARSTLTPAQQLVEMGFYNVALNERLLKEKNNDVAAVVAELVNMSDSDWYASRQSSEPTTRD